MKKHRLLFFVCVILGAGLGLFWNHRITTLEPYVQAVNGTQAVISVITEQPAVAMVQFGPHVYANRAFESAPASVHAVTLRGLVPGTRYYYRVLTNDGKKSRSCSFKTAPDRGPCVFLVASDSQLGGKAYVRAAAYMAARQFDFYLNCGDLANDGSSYPQYFFSPSYRILARAPFYPVRGNHDTFNGGQNFPLYFKVRPNGDRRYYYSFDWGDTHFAVLDFNQSLAPGSAQNNWLAQDLAASGKEWKVVAVHGPPFTTYEPYARTGLGRDLVPVFERYNVDLVVYGHSHVYEHIARKKTHYLQQTCVAAIPRSAGAAFRRHPDNPVYATGTVLLNSSYNLTAYSHVTIDGGTLTVRVYNAATNALVDEWAIRKQP